jgi:tctex1 domain-containing protein 2
MDFARAPSSVSGTAVYQGLAKPESKAKFRPGHVKEIIRDVLSKLGDVKYNHDTSGVLVKQISTEIRDRARQLNFQKYKILVHVVIGALKGQGIRAANRCFWDSETDDVASETFRNVSQLFDSRLPSF